MMGEFFRIFVLVLAGILLCCFGLGFLFRRPRKKAAEFLKAAELQPAPGPAPRSEGPRKTLPCPVCGARLEEGELVKSSIFPSFNGKERLMHIRGCGYCLEGAPLGGRQRVCPVCGAILNPAEYLIAKMFDHPGKRHVHVLGCSRCRKG